MKDPVAREIGRLRTELRAAQAMIEVLTDRIGEMARKVDREAPINVVTLPMPDPSFDEIVKLVCAHYGVTLQALRSDRRARAIARPRQVACWLAVEATGLSLPAIGRLMGGRDHTTIMHARNTVRSSRADDPEFKAETDALLGRVREAVKEADAA